MNPKIPLKSTISARSPEASEAIVHIVDGLLFGVGQPCQHPRRRLPGNFALGVEIPHRVTGILEFSKNLGDQLSSGAAWAVIFDPLMFDIHPESKNLGHSDFHSCVLTQIAARCSVKLA
jgi:hypothetical protein